MLGGRSLRIFEADLFSLLYCTLVEFDDEKVKGSVERFMNRPGRRKIPYAFSPRLLGCILGLSSRSFRRVRDCRVNVSPERTKDSACNNRTQLVLYYLDPKLNAIPFGICCPFPNCERATLIYQFPLVFYLN